VSLICFVSLCLAPTICAAEPIVVTAEFTTTSPVAPAYGFSDRLGISLAQSFLTTVAGDLVSFDVRLERQRPDLGGGILTAEIYAAVDGAPSGPALASVMYSGFFVPTFASWVTLGGFNLPVLAGQSYAIALSGSANDFLWYGRSGNLYADGTIARQFYDDEGNVTSPWHVHPEETGDLNFRALVDLGTEQPPAPTPEPGTLGLIALGGLVAARVRRSRVR
jgi:hypothetical protein